MLIVAGALVGASGTLLTILMGRAMNRSLTNVLFGAFGSVVAAPADAGTDGRSARATTADDVAVMLAYARRVVFVPGYGLAVAQAQHDVRALADLLQEKGVDVRYAIHPVAGRMPGHMNVLLAEANVPYDQLYEMDQINPEFSQTDVAVVVGANDVVNPAARNQPASPIYGMPILDVDKSLERRRDQAVDVARVRGDRQPAVLRPEDRDAVRGREVGGRERDRRRQGRLAPGRDGHTVGVTAILVVSLVVSIVTWVGVLASFVWAARKDGEEDRALQARLGIRRRTRLGR